MTAHNGRGQGGDLPYEGVVLPANGESYPPEQHGSAERGGPPQPAAGQPWGQPWGPESPSPPTGGPVPHRPPAPAHPADAPPPPSSPPEGPPTVPPGGEQDRLPQPYGTSGAGAAPLPPAAPGAGQWAPPPPAGPPTPPPAYPPPGAAAPESPAGPPPPYDPPAAPPPAPYGHGQGQGHGPLYGDADATQMLPPQPAPPGPGPLPPVADAEATQMLPPQQPGWPGPAPEIGDPWPAAQRGTADAEATQMLPPQPGGAGTGWPQQPAAGDAEATQMLPPQPGTGDVDATQMLPPQGAGGVPADPHHGHAAAPAEAGPPPAGAPYGIRPGAPADRQPPSEFDNLFRSDAPAAGRTGGAGHRGADRSGPDTAPGAAPYGRAARRDAGRQQPGRGGKSPAVLAGIGVVVVLAVGLGVGALTSGGGEEKQPEGAPTVPVASGLPSEPAETADTADTAEQQAKQLSGLLEKSNNSRNSVIRAVQNIKACQALDTAASDLRAAARQRNGLVARLAQIETGALPHSTELDAELKKAWKASAEADNAYAAWADQVAGKKGCKKGKARTTHKTAVGNRASGEATAAKKKAAELWNPTAREYGLPERQYTQL